jgi:hypothetical protein
MTRLTPDAVKVCPAHGHYTASRCPRCPQDAPAPSARVSERPDHEVRQTGRNQAPYGRCPHTGRPYRSKTEARWAAEHPTHLFEPFPVGTPCGVYWPDFVEEGESKTADYRGQPFIERRLYEVKGAYIRDRALHKVKAAIRPARCWLDAEGIWLAQWDGERWTVTEVQEG